MSNGIKSTMLEITEPYWIIISYGDKGTGYYTELVQCIRAKDLVNMIANGTEEAGASMGDFDFTIIGKSHDNLLEIAKYEELNEQEQNMAGFAKE